MAGLRDIPVSGVLRAEDFQRARKFYTEVLELAEAQESGELTQQGMFMAGAGTAVTVYERPGLPAPANTTLGFGVPADKFDALVAELRAKGVVFEDYDLPEIGLKTVAGVATLEGRKAAWFKDSEGNTLSLSTMQAAVGQQVFTRESLAQFDGKDGRPAYVAYEGKVYDVSGAVMWEGGDHQGEHQAGADLTAEMDDAPHLPDELDAFPVVGTLAE